MKAYENTFFVQGAAGDWKPLRDKCTVVCRDADDLRKIIQEDNSLLIKLRPDIKSFIVVSREVEDNAVATS